MNGPPENGLKTLVRLLKEDFHDCFSNFTERRTWRMEIAIFAFVPANVTANFDEWFCGECAINYPAKGVSLQCTVAFEGFGLSRKRRFDRIYGVR